MIKKQRSAKISLVFFRLGFLIILKWDLGGKIGVLFLIKIGWTSVLWGNYFLNSKNRYPILHDHNLIKKNLAYILTEKNRLFDHFGSDFY